MASPFDRPPPATARRAQEVFAQLEAYSPRYAQWQRAGEPALAHLRLTSALVSDRPLRRTLDGSNPIARSSIKSVKPAHGPGYPHRQGLNHEANPSR